jgi:hypothetical protein
MSIICKLLNQNLKLSTVEIYNLIHLQKVMEAEYNKVKFHLFSKTTIVQDYWEYHLELMILKALD